MKFSDEERNDPRHKRRDLNAEDYESLGIPKDLWDVQFAGIQEPNKPSAGNYVRNIVPLVLRGYGMWLLGGAGVGKSAIAAILAKAALAHRFRCYFTTLPDFRERLVTKAEYMEDVTYMQRATTCELLVVDDLNEHNAENRIFGISDIRDLIRKRVSSRLATIVTTQLPPARLNQLLFDTFSSSRHRMPVFTVTGRDLYEAKMAEASTIFDPE